MSLPPALVARSLFSYQDAAAVGISVRQLDSAVRRRRLARIRRGWFTVEDMRRPSDRHRLRAQAELLERAGDVVASHTTGALLHGLPVRAVGLIQVHLTWTRHAVGTRTRGGVSIHQLPARVQVPEGSHTLPLGLICVQAAIVDPPSGLMAADRAVRDGRITRDDLARGLEQLTGVRSKGQAAFIVRLVDDRRESPGESELAYACYLLGHDLEPQIWLSGASGQQYRVDSVLRGTPVIVEYDGRDKYAARQDLLMEKHREDDLRAVGFDFVRVTSELLRKPDELERRLRLALERTGAQGPRPTSRLRVDHL